MSKAENSAGSKVVKKAVHLVVKMVALKVERMVLKTAEPMVELLVALMGHWMAGLKVGH